MKPEILQRIRVEIDVSQADLIALGSTQGKPIASRTEAARFVKHLATIYFKKLRQGDHLKKATVEGE